MMISCFEEPGYWDLLCALELPGVNDHNSTFMQCKPSSYWYNTCIFFYTMIGVVIKLVKCDDVVENKKEC